MFKTITLYWCGPGTAAPSTDLMKPFRPTLPTQTASIGWVPPRGDQHGALVELVLGTTRHRLMRVRTETRSVPAATVAARVDEMAEALEQSTGRKPGRKARKELKEQAVLELLPQAFARHADVPVWLDTETGYVAIGAAGPRAHEAATLLVHSIQGLNLRQLQTATGPAPAMMNWLASGEPPEGFAVDRECELQSDDELKSVVRYARHQLDTDEIRQHLRAGKVPTKLALTWQGRVSFLLNDRLQLRKIELLDVVLEGQSNDGDAFDADAAIVTGELSQLFADLVEALDGRAPDAELPFDDDEPAVRMENLVREDGATATVTTASGQVLGSFGEGPDPLLDQARAVVLRERRASISLVQRHLRIGYNRAARLLESLQQEGLVTPMDNAGHREISKAVAA